MQQEKQYIAIDLKSFYASVEASRPAKEGTADTSAEATFTFFVTDKMKSGGSYETVTGRIKKHDALKHTILLNSGRVIPIGDLCEVSCPEYERQRSGNGAGYSD